MMTAKLSKVLRSSLLASCIAWLTTTQATAQTMPLATNVDPYTLASSANQAFDAGDLVKATHDYEQLLGQGIVNGHLFYNLGVAYFRAGRLGDSVAAFLGARRYLPRDPDNEANLRFVLGKVHDKLEAQLPATTTGHVAAWLEHFNELELAWTASLLAALWGSALALTALRPSLERWRLSVALSVVLPIAALAAFLTRQATPDAWGAVVQAEAKIYSGPGKQNTQLFALQEGAPVLITERAAGGYYRVKLSDGKQGWVADNQVRLFGPL